MGIKNARATSTTHPVPKKELVFSVSDANMLMSTKGTLMGGMINICKKECFETVEKARQLCFATAGRQHGAAGERRGRRKAAEKRANHRTGAQCYHFLSRVQFSVFAYV